MFSSPTTHFLHFSECHGNEMTHKQSRTVHQNRINIRFNIRLRSYRDACLITKLILQRDVNGAGQNSTIPSCPYTFCLFHLWFCSFHLYFCAVVRCNWWSSLSYFSLGNWEKLTLFHYKTRSLSIAHVCKNDGIIRSACATCPQREKWKNDRE